MNSHKRTTRLGVLVAGSAAMLAFGMTAPAMAQQPVDGGVGQAQFKAQPKGQYAGDTNHGFTCDDNKGIGDGNPAHPNICPDTSVTDGGAGGTGSVPDVS